MKIDEAYLDVFRENGQKIAFIRSRLVEMAENFADLTQIDREAERLIRKAGGEPAFQKVPRYSWSTCLCVNDAFVHCIPQGKLKSGDIITIDVGMTYHATTSDTATTIQVGEIDEKTTHFLNVGKKSLKKAILEVKPGNKVKDISKALQRTIEKSGFSVTRNLTGHGLGKTMHEEPQIPMYISKDPCLQVRLYPGMVLAVETMYMEGDWALNTDEDGWTMRTADGSRSAMFEEDVIVTNEGFEQIT